MEMPAYYLALVFLTALIITFFVLPSVIEVAHAKRLFDVPDQRKQHQHAIPSLGGVGIFIGMLIAYTIWANPAAFADYKYLLVAYLVLFFMGLKDDLILMSAGKKLVIQLIVAAWLAYGGIRIEHLFGITGLENISIWISYPITLFFIVAITNAFNLIDGIDGLAGGLGGINCLTLGALLYVFGDTNYAVLAFAVSGALFAFLYYNFSQYPKKMFMGDTGSLLLGLTVALLGIRFMQLDAPQVGNLRFASPPLILLGVLFIPIFDTVRVMAIRIASGRSPFSPDRNHIHHELLRSGADHKQASLILYVINIVLVVTVLAFRELNSALGLGFIILFVGATAIQVLVFVRYRGRERKLNDLNAQLEAINKQNQFMR